MKYDIEKRLIEIDNLIKSHMEHDNAFTLSILQKCREIALDLKEYEDLEEQGLLLKLPCKVGDTVYFISEKTERRGRKKVATEFIDEGAVDNITIGSIMMPRITVCNGENTWDMFNAADFGKIIFLTPEAAEEALKEVE